MKSNMPRQYSGSLPARIMLRVDIKSDNECWPYIGSRSSAGYGNIRYKGKYYLAHREIARYFYGRKIEGKYICHKCDNPPCCNPYHLFVGTPSENMQDCAKKKRVYSALKILTEAQILEILYLTHEGFTQKALAKRFGVCQGTISYHLIKRYPIHSGNVE